MDVNAILMFERTQLSYKFCISNATVAFIASKHDLHLRRRGLHLNFVERGLCLKCGPHLRSRSQLNATVTFVDCFAFESYLFVEKSDRLKRSILIATGKVNLAIEG